MSARALIAKNVPAASRVGRSPRHSAPGRETRNPKSEKRNKFEQKEMNKQQKPKTLLGAWEQDKLLEYIDCDIKPMFARTVPFNQHRQCPIF
jgi:hypothetical protein